MAEGPLRTLVDALHDLYAGGSTIPTIVQIIDGSKAWANPPLSSTSVHRLLHGNPTTLANPRLFEGLVKTLASFPYTGTDGDPSRTVDRLVALHREAFTPTEDKWGSNVSDHFAQMAMRWGESLDSEPRQGVQGVVTITCIDSEGRDELGAFSPSLHFEVNTMLESRMYFRFGTTSRKAVTDLGASWWGIWGARGHSNQNQSFDAYLFTGVRLDTRGAVSVYFRDCLPDANGRLVEHLVYDAWAAIEIAARWGLTGTAHATFMYDFLPGSAQDREEVHLGEHSAHNYQLELDRPMSRFSTRTGLVEGQRRSSSTLRTT